MPQTCLPLYATLTVEFGVTPGAEIRIVPDNVDCDDVSFPIPWSSPINVPTDFTVYAQTVNNGLRVKDYYNRLGTSLPGGLNVEYRLQLNPEWTEIFGGCGAKIKVCVRNGSLLDLAFPNGNVLQCCPIEPLPDCDCNEEKLYLLFKFDSLTPLPPFANAYVFRFGLSESFDCNTPPGDNSLRIPPWLASNPTLANQWLAAAINGSEIFNTNVCLWPGGYVGLWVPLNDETLYFCNTPFGYCVGAQFWPSGYVNDPSLIDLSFPFTSEGNPIYHCCSTPPPLPDYPPNYCLPPCGCEKACAAVGCFDELAVRLKSGLAGYPPPGATVTVLIQEGYRKMMLTGVYDGTGVKVALTPEQKKFFIFFRSYSVAVFWNGQIWPMADDAQCKYFVAYPGPSQTTLTI